MVVLSVGVVIAGTPSRCVPRRSARARSLTLRPLLSNCFSPSRTPTRREPPCRERRLAKSNDAEKAELGEGGDPIIQTDLLDDLAVLELQDGDPGEVHLPARVGGEATGKEIVEGRAGVGSAAFPLTDDAIAVGKEVGRAPEFQIGECSAESVMKALVSAGPFRDAW